LAEDSEVINFTSEFFPEATTELHWTASVGNLHTYIDMTVEGILRAVKATDHRCYLTGTGNFREKVATWGKYKGGRGAKPRLYKAAREYLVQRWGAEVVNGIEADDALGIYQCSHKNTVICSIDKDLLMIPGDHYNFSKGVHMKVEPIEAYRNFYKQCLTGDTIDNIPGLRKWTGRNATKAMKEEIDKLDTPEDMETFVTDCYLLAGATLEEFNETATLLWILRKVPV
jgi:hypothetical protein